MQAYLPGPGAKDDYPLLAPALARPIRWDLIARQYDQMVKYATAIRTGTATTEAILRRFTRNASHPTYAAMLEVGRAEKTAFLARYLRIREMQREVNDGLNVVESWNGANDIIHFGKRGDIASNRRDEQELEILCLHILQAAMVYINTLMIQDVLGETGWAGIVTDEDRRGLTPLFWTHVLPYGEVHLDLGKRLTLGEAACPPSRSRQRKAAPPHEPPNLPSLRSRSRALMSDYDSADALIKRTPAKRKARQLAKHLRSERPDYAYLKEVFRHLRDELGVDVTKAPKTLPSVPAQEEIRRYYETVWTARRTGDIVLIKTLLYTGVRVAELVKIRLEDVDLDACRIRITQGKGGKDRYVPVPAAFKETLALHIAALREKGAVFLFESSWKKPYSTRGVRAILARYARKAGLDHNMPPHRLRHFLFT